jgi:hypothetical protein
MVMYYYNHALPRYARRPVCPTPRLLTPMLSPLAHPPAKGSNSKSNNNYDDDNDDKVDNIDNNDNDADDADKHGSKHPPPKKKTSVTSDPRPVQHTAEVPPQVRKEKQIVHKIQLEDSLGTYPFWCTNFRNDHRVFWADIFHSNSDYLENEERYKNIKAEIIGDGSSDDDKGTF